MDENDIARLLVNAAFKIHRALGPGLLESVYERVLAHELGHYLLASKVHTKQGLLKASRTAGELFAPEARGFQLDPSQRQAMAARLRRETLVVSR